ncbi:hypothetical protein CR513_37315, partial [Mucuna pruriens]
MKSNHIQTTILEEIVPTESELSAAYNTEIWISWDHVGFKSSQLLATRSKIPVTCILPTTVTANATARKFSHSGGFDFTISIKYNCYYT